MKFKDTGFFRDETNNRKQYSVCVLSDEIKLHSSNSVTTMREDLTIKRSFLMVVMTLSEILHCTSSVGCSCWLMTSI